MWESSSDQADSDSQRPVQWSKYIIPRITTELTLYIPDSLYSEAGQQLPGYKSVMYDRTTIKYISKYYFWATVQNLRASRLSEDQRVFHLNMFVVVVLC